MDDEPLVLALARNALERSGYSVLTAESGTEAEEIMQLHAREIEVVILDVTMPRMNGEEAFRG